MKSIIAAGIFLTFAGHTMAQIPADVAAKIREIGAVLRKYDDWGLVSADLAGPPRRFWSDGETQPVPIVDMGIDVHRVVSVASPGQLLADGPGSDAWAAMSRRSMARPTRARSSS